MDGIEGGTRAALLEASIDFFSRREVHLASLEGPVRRAWVDEWVLAPLEEARALEVRLAPAPAVAEVMELLKVLWRCTFAGVPCAGADEQLPMIGFPAPEEPPAKPAPRRKSPPARPAPRRGPAPKKPAPRRPDRRRKR